MCMRIFCLVPLALAVLLKAAAGPPDDFTFTDATAAVGLADALKGALNHGVAWGDFDGDGRVDLFLGNFADRAGQPLEGINRLFRQVEGGKFVPFSAPAVERKGRCSGAVFVDLDNDGDLDLYVTSNTLPRAGAKEPAKTVQAEPSRLFRNDGGGKFVDISASCGACPPDLFRSRDIGVLDYDGDGLLDLFVNQDHLLVRDKLTPHSRLFRNLGGLKFADVTEKVGLPKDISALGLAIADLNGDSRPDIFTGGSNRLFLSQSGGRYKEAESLRAVFEHKPSDRGEDFICGACFADLDLDGDFDLLTGPHFAPARIHVYLNEGLKDGVPRFRDIAQELGIPPIPQKAAQVEIQDFDNDGIPDIYCAAYFAEGAKRWPFICKGLGVKDGLPRFRVPSVASVQTEYVRKNLVPPKGLGMVYYVDGPAVDYDGDGDLDLFAGIWPEECSRFFRNDTKGGHWLQVKVQGTKMNRMGVGAQVRVYAPGTRRLLGFQEITQNVGYSSSKPALAHVGLGKVETCDVEVTFSTQARPVVLRGTKVNQRIVVREP